MRGLFLGCWLCLGLGCAGGSDLLSGTGTGLRRATTGAGQGASAGSAGASGTSAAGPGTSSAGSIGTGSGASTSGGDGSSAGTTGAPPCSVAPGLNDCESGQIEILAQIVSYGAGSVEQPISSGLAISDLDDPSQLIQADSCGYFHSCTFAGTQVRLEVDSPNYAPANLPLMVAAQSTQLAAKMVLVPESLAQGLVLQAGDYQADAGALFVVTQSSSTSGRCASNAGWAFSLRDRSGSVVAAQVAYIDTAGIDTGATSTDALGVTILYNIDPTVGDVQLKGVDAEADGGLSACGIDTLLPFTAQLPVVAGRFTDVVFGVH